jgi:hypothetical protein
MRKKHKPPLTPAFESLAHRAAGGVEQAAVWGTKCRLLHQLLPVAQTSAASARGANGGRVLHRTAPRDRDEMWELLSHLSRKGEGVC